MSPKRTIVSLLVVALVVVVVVLVARADDEPPFLMGDTSVTTADADGLLRGERLASAHVAPIDEDQPLLVQLRGPGSRAFDFAVVRLDDDAAAMRVRQVARGSAADEVPGAAVDWRSYVAVQRPAVRGRPSFGPWREAGKDGVVVRPGQQVRLRTVFTLGPRTGPCAGFTLEDGPLWLQREDGTGDPWTRLVYRDPRDGTDADARSGQHGPLAFRQGSDAACADGVPVTLGQGADELEP